MSANVFGENFGESTDRPNVGFLTVRGEYIVIAVEREESRQLHPAVAQFFVRVAYGSRQSQCMSIRVLEALIDIPLNPHVSTPNMGMPNSAKFSAWEMPR